jgi:hypothetical protein
MTAARLFRSRVSDTRLRGLSERSNSQTSASSSPICSDRSCHRLTANRIRLCWAFSKSVLGVRAENGGRLIRERAWIGLVR